MNTTFLHTMIRVKDLDKSIKFYEDCLNLTVSRKVEREAKRYSLAFLGNPNSNAEVELTYNWDNTEDYSEGRKFGHLAFQVDDAQAICNKAKELGYTVTKDPATAESGNIMAFIRDPDDNSIELIQKA